MAVDSTVAKAVLRATTRAVKTKVDRQVKAARVRGNSAPAKGTVRDKDSADNRAKATSRAILREPLAAVVADVLAVARVADRVVAAAVVNNVAGLVAVAIETAVEVSRANRLL